LPAAKKAPRDFFDGALFLLECCGYQKLIFAPTLAETPPISTSSASAADHFSSPT
jgi:hypothetical protein